MLECALGRVKRFTFKTSLTLIIKVLFIYHLKSVASGRAVFRMG